MAAALRGLLLRGGRRLGHDSLTAGLRGSLGAEAKTVSAEAAKFWEASCSHGLLFRSHCSVARERLAEVRAVGVCRGFGSLGVNHGAGGHATLPPRPARVQSCLETRSYCDVARPGQEERGYIPLRNSVEKSFNFKPIHIPYPKMFKKRHKRMLQRLEFSRLQVAIRKRNTKEARARKLEKRREKWRAAVKRRDDWNAYLESKRDASS